MHSIKASDRYDEPVTEEVLARAIKRGKNRPMECHMEDEDEQQTGDWSDGCGEGPAGETDDDDLE